MVSRRLVFLLLAGLVLSGCGQTGNIPVSETDSSGEDLSANDHGGSGVGGSVIPGIPGGVILPDGFAIRSIAAKGEGDELVHVARLEFRGGADRAVDALRKAFAQAEFRQMSSEDGEDGNMTRIFRSSEGLRVRAVFIPKGPNLKLELNSPDSGGVATLYWRDASASMPSR